LINRSYEILSEFSCRSVSDLQPNMMSFSITRRSKFGGSTAGILWSPLTMNARQDLSVNFNGLR